MTHHDAMVYDAKKAPNDLDIVFVGDSITERWNGTAALGTKVIDSTKRAFRKRFTKKYGGKLEGIALGSAGDTVSPMCVSWLCCISVFGDKNGHLMFSSTSAQT